MAGAGGLGAPIAGQPPGQPHWAAAGADAAVLRSVTTLLRNSPQPSCVVGTWSHELAPEGPQGTAAPHLRPSSSSGSIGAGCAPEGAPPWIAYALLPADTPPDAERDAPSRSGSGEPLGPLLRTAAAAAVPPPPGAPVAVQAPALGSLVYHNTALEGLCGYSAQQLQQDGLELLLRPAANGDRCGGGADAAEAQRGAMELSAALASGAPCSLELPCFHASGRRLWCQVHVSRLEADGQAAAGADEEEAAAAADAEVRPAEAPCQPAWRRRHTDAASARSGGGAGGCDGSGGTGGCGGRGGSSSAAGAGAVEQSSSAIRSGNGGLGALLRHWPGGGRMFGFNRNDSGDGACGGAKGRCSGDAGKAASGGAGGSITHSSTRACAAAASVDSRGRTLSIVEAARSAGEQQHVDLNDLQMEALQRQQHLTGEDHDALLRQQQQDPQLGHQHGEQFLQPQQGAEGPHQPGRAPPRRAQRSLLLLLFQDVTVHRQLQQQQAMLQQHVPAHLPQPPSPVAPQAQEQPQPPQWPQPPLGTALAPGPAPPPPPPPPPLEVALPAALADGVCCLRDFALDSVREGITIADPSAPDSPIVYTNNAFLAMTGYSREEVLGRNCRFLQGPGTEPAAVAAIRGALSRREPLTVQLLNYSKGGTAFWNELRLVPVLQPATGRLLAYIGFQSDVSELVARKQSEARLRDAKEAAESATEAKSQFVANMSHEIRTPLNGMIATAQLLLGSSLTPEQRELAETILESGSTLLGILGDILDFSKIDHGSVELQRRPMCLRQATEACIDLVAAEAAKKGLALAYLMDDEALARPLLGDPVRVRQVLANLLSNAVKFTERGEVVVRVAVERAAECRNPHAAASTAAACAAAAKAAPGPQAAATQAVGAAAAAAAAPPPRRPCDHAEGDAPPDGGNGSSGSSGGEVDGEGDGDETVVHIAVSDTGIGIGADSARKLFQHFRQGSETMSRRYGGTGLGLAISKRLAQLMDGDIWVDSRVGAGSTFHFTLRAEWACGAGPWPWSPTRSAASTAVNSSVCTPRTSTDEAPGGAAAAAAVAAAALDAGQPWECSAAGGGGSGRLSGSSTGSAASGSGSATGSGSGSVRGGRGLRTSPWLPDGTPIEAAAAAGAAGAASATVAPPTPPLGLSASGLQSGSSAGGGSAVAVGAAEAADERAALLGRSVLVDVSHSATSTQVWNSCRQLGLAATQADACPHPPLPPPRPQPSSYQGRASAPSFAPATASAAALAFASAAPPTPISISPSASPAPPPAAEAEAAAPPPQYDILIVSMDRLVPALKAGWKGRPVVALGDREQLPPALQPLVVVTLLPVRHSRLVTALVKATALLRWNGSSAPKLGNAPIPTESILTLKSWRLKRGADMDNINRRTSLDNSALERAAMARGGAARGGGGAACKGAPGGKISPGRQQVPIPEHAELPPVPDDALGCKLPLQPISSPLHADAVLRSQAPPVGPPAAAPAPASRHVAAGTPPAAAAAAPASDAGGGGGGQHPLQHLRILIAEDNKVNQKVVIKVLQQILRGCTPPDVVENGLQVLAALRRKSYDLILMDIHMPEMDGLEASRRIQETYGPEERPRIIALSADTVQTLHERCREAGIEAFLVKPFRVEELARHLRTAPPLLRKPLEQDPTARAPPLAA